MQDAVAIIRRIYVPNKVGGFGLVGAAIGLFGDVVNFFTGFVSQSVLVVLLLVFAVIVGYVCFRLIRGDRALPDSCPECNAARFGAFAALTLAMLTLVGGGGSGTEAIGQQLGLIREDVTAIRDTLEPQSINADAQTAAEHFANAWIHENYRRDSVGAARALDAVYALGPAHKMDGAELWFATRAVSVPREQVRDAGIALGRRLRDPAFLVVAARSAPDRVAAEALREEAQAMDPSFPFAWFDPIQPGSITGGTFKPGEMAQRTRAELQRIEKFLALYEAQPPSRWHFMPQHVGDMTATLRPLTDMYRQTLAQYESMAKGRTPDDVLRDLRAQAK